jgi:preprotein translocase subunit SecE
MKKLIKFLKEVKQEVKKVTWLSKKEVFKYSLLVILVSAGVAVYLGGVDYIVTTLLDKFI